MFSHLHSRRRLLQLGVASAAAKLLPHASSARLTSWLGDPPPSPRLTPFLAPLPIPPIAQLRPAFAHTAPLPVGFGGSPQFLELVSEARSVSLHPQLPPTRVWGYRDANSPTSPLMLGPTVVGRNGQPLVVRLHNDLPRDHQGFGLTHSVLHWHGAHLPALSDGFPENVHGYSAVIDPGQSYDYALPNLDPGAIDGEPDPGERPSTMWYHDHVLDFTAQNVMRGLAGMFLFFDELDTGDETTGLRLPSGAYDIPLVLQDRRLDARGQLWYDPLDHNGFLGDLFLVNGAVQPHLDVAARKYRFRLLNACNARFLGMHIVRADGRPVPFDLIATEGGLMSAPLRGESRMMLAPAQRLEAIVDFSQFPPGTVLYLENRVEQPDGRGPRGTFDRPRLLARGDRFLRIRVGDPAPDQSLSPDVLRPFAPVSAAELARAERRELRFQRSNGVWVVNGESVDLERPIFTVGRGVPQIWTLRNSSGGWWHPVHVHSEHMRVLRRNGRTPSPVERDGRSRMDTVTLGPGDEVEVFVKFRDYPGRWVLHCHTIEHEDAFMMTCFDVE